MDQDQLQNLRKEIDQLNSELVTLLNKRATVAQQIGKAKQGAAIYQPAREAQVLKQVVENNRGPLSDAAVTAVFKEIIAVCRNLQQPLRVAYLGPAGTYSEEAAKRHCGATSELVSYANIDDVVRAAEKGDTTIAVVPLENSTEGAVNRTLDLLLQTPLAICGEVILPIRHQLLSKADTVDVITEVMAHPQALAQCRQWLDKHIPKATRTAVSSNAEAARLAAERPRSAAIAGTSAAELYKLSPLAKNIEDEPNNTTRFVVLGTEQVVPTGNDKTSIVVSTPNEPGALHRILRILADQNINMNKIESRPMASKLWEYVFYIDLEGHQDDYAVQTALDQIKQATSLYKVLGSYPKGS